MKRINPDFEQNNDRLSPEEEALCRQIRESASDVKIPDSLSPEAVRKRLEKLEKPAGASTPDPKPSFFLRNRKRIFSAAGLCAAAMFAVVFFWQQDNLRHNEAGQPNSQTADDAVLTEAANEEAENGEIMTLEAAPEAAADVAGDADGASADAGNEVGSLPEDAGEMDGVLADGGQNEAADETNGVLADGGQAKGADAANGVLADGGQAKDADAADESAAEDPAASLAEARARHEEEMARVLAALPIRTASSYDELYQTLSSAFGTGDYGYATAKNYDLGRGVFAEDEAFTDTLTSGSAETIMEDSVADMAMSASEAKDVGSDYSQTNLQEIGVDEGDVVKTDGRYLYVMKPSGSVHLVALNGPSMESAAVIRPSSPNETLQEIYLDGDTLLLVAQGHTTSLQASGTDESGKVYTMRSESQTTLYTYDISDRTAPTLTGKVTQSGDYRTSRKTGNYVYLITEYKPYLADTWQDSRIAPLVNDQAMAADQIFLPQQLSSRPYLVISSVDIRNPGETIDQASIVSGSTHYYVSTENIYIATQSWDVTTRTDLIRVEYKDGFITPSAAGSVNGYLNNSFSMSEYNGYLRLVVTANDGSGQESNSLFILGPDLTITGSIRDLAPGEQIRSARFLGDIGYFVTFRQTDPLFCADLSDPTNPVILGELKVTGFSSYLHPYGENLLLGLGYEADPETGFTTGLKLSMFDTSESANVTEADRLVIKDITWCQALDNYKAILADTEKNLIGFFCNSGYLVFSYDKDCGFTSLLTADLSGEETWNFIPRGVFVDDTLYLVTGASVRAYDMSDGFSYQGKLVLEQ